MLKMLLKDPRVDPTAKDNYALRYSLRQIDNKKFSGDKEKTKETIEILLSDPKVIETYGCANFIHSVLMCRFDYITDPKLKIKALEVAAKIGDHWIVNSLLYKHQKDLKGRDKAIEIAKKNGHDKVLYSLLNNYI